MKRGRKPVYGNSRWMTSSVGTVLVHIAANPGCTVVEIADALELTQRTVWGVIGFLRSEGCLRVERRVKTHHYFIAPDAEFAHPTVKGVPLGVALDWAMPVGGTV